MRVSILLCMVLGVVAQRPSDGDNLETFPSIIGDLSSTTRSFSSLSSRSTNTPFNPSAFPTAPGPALPPSSYLTAPSYSGTGPTASIVSPSKTLVSASQAASSGANSSSSATVTGTPSESLVTSTVDGSVTTVTITNSAAPANAAVRTRAGEAVVGWAVVGSIGAVLVGGALAAC